ncbi:JNK-interacting protein 1 [Zootermopsis nevadensis]|uniref:JNK-interacting protein 1 n=1 Tax=Zootermopsis nevadensis TaxID=136037 RepID=A0A067R0Q6_ZOONE|nr:JNK-interacting protein 1 [Zootermopsis nevadensis]
MRRQCTALRLAHFPAVRSLLLRHAVMAGSTLSGTPYTKETVTGLWGHVRTISDLASRDSESDENDNLSQCHGRDAHFQRRHKASCVAQRIVGRVERDGVNGSRLTINMADTEFEEFRHYFERLPQHIKAPAQSYTLVHDVLLDEDSNSTTSKSDGEEDPLCCSPTNSIGSEPHRASGDLDDDEDEVTATVSTETRGRERGTPGSGVSLPLHGEEQGGGSGGDHLSTWTDQHRLGPASVMAIVQPSLADELADLMDTGDSVMPESLQFAVGGQTRPLFILKCHSYLRDEAISPDSERFHSTDVDSGNSTAHSPDGLKSMSPQLGQQGFRSPESTSPSSSGGVPFTQLELLEATHRGLHKFVPRHHDEIEVEIGDPIYVQKEADDLWRAFKRFYTKFIETAYPIEDIYIE